MTQLLNELSVFEHLNKDKSKEVEANNVEEKPSSSSDKKRKREDKDKSISKPKKEKKAPKAKKNKKKPKSKGKEPQGKCFHCDIVGHWKRNCKKYLLELKKKGKLDLLILEASLVEDDKSLWIVDSGATNHICSSMQILDDSRELADGEVILRVGNGAHFSAKAVSRIPSSSEGNPS